MNLYLINSNYYIIFGIFLDRIISNNIQCKGESVLQGEKLYSYIYVAQSLLMKAYLA